MDLRTIVWYLFLSLLIFEIAAPYIFNPQTKTKKREKTQQSEPQTQILETPQPVKVDFDIRQTVHDDFLTIQYCQQCGYKQRVDQIRLALHDLYPQLGVNESQYPLDPMWSIISKQFLNSVLSIFRVVGIAFLFLGDNLFAFLQMPYPAWYLYVQNNKFSIGIFLFLGVGMLSSWVTQTGAFEVFYDGQLIFSGLKRKKIPSVEEILVPLHQMGLRIFS